MPVLVIGEGDRPYAEVEILPSGAVTTSDTFATPETVSETVKSAAKTGRSAERLTVGVMIFAEYTFGGVPSEAPGLITLKLRFGKIDASCASV